MDIGYIDNFSIDIVQCLIKGQEEVKEIVGHIRTKEKCPVCNKNFKHLEKLGFICTDCKTVPRRFYIDLHWKGKRIRIFSDKQGIPLDSYQRAYNIQAKISYEIDNHQFDPSRYVEAEQSKFYIKNLFEKWKEAKTWSFKYQKQVKYAEGYIFKFFAPGHDVREIRSYDIHSFSQFLKEKKLSMKSQYNILGILKAFLSHLAKLEYIEKMPAFPTLSVPEPSWKWLSEDQQAEIFKHIPEDDRDIFIFMALHGTRPGEARGLKVGDIDFDLQAITIQRAFSGHVLSTTKNKRNRTIPIHPAFIVTLKRLCKDKLPEAFVFTYSKTKKHYGETTLRRLWAKATKKVGIKITMYEGLRHSWASQRASSVPIYLISKALGHCDVRVTKRYTHTDLESLRACFVEKDNVVKLDRHQKPSPDRHQANS